MLLHDEPRAIPSWTREQVERYLNDNYRRYEPLLACGAYHHLLPLELRRRSVVEQFDVPRFIQAVAGLHLEPAPEALAEELLDLVIVLTSFAR